MIWISLVVFLLLAAGVILLFGLTPEDITLYAVWRRPDLKVTVLGTDEIKSMTEQGDTITLYIYSSYNTTVLETNQPVKWSYPSNGVLYNIVEQENRFFFVPSNVGSGNNYKNATITVTSEDGQQITVIVNPVDGKP